MASLLLDNFAGGLNLRDSPNRIQTGLDGPAESPGCFNWALIERGGIKRRNGHANVGTLPGTAGTAAYIFWSQALGVFVCARASGGALKVFTSATGGTGTWTDRGTINSVSTAVAAFCDFPRAGAGAAGPVCVITTDVNSGATRGTWILDSTFALAQATGGQNIAGTAIALWQDRAIVAGYPVSDANGNPTRFFATAPKVVDFAAAGSWNNDVREKDAAPLTGLAVVGGALVVFKKDSHYRVNDSANGSYTTIDSAVGAVNARAIVQLLGRLWFWAPGGIFRSDGIGAADNVGDKLRPIFQHASTDQATIIAGVSEDHVMFCGTLGGTAFSGNTGQIIDYAPTLGGAVLHTHYNSAQDEFSSFTMKDGILYAAVKDGDDLFKMFTETPGVDDATQTTSGYRMAWLLPNGGALARLQRLRVQGYLQTVRTQSITVQKDWLPAGGDVYALDGLLPSGAHEQMAVDVQSLGHASSFGLSFGIAGGSGAMSIRAIELITTQLSYPERGYPRQKREGGEYKPDPKPDPIPNQRRLPRPGPMPIPVPGKSPPPQ